MVQSSGSSGTVALANALISDVVMSADRGASIGYAQMGAMVGPAFGPIIGGLLNQFQGWRAIFWFLATFSGTVFVIIVVALPETCRKIVGNGSVPPPGYSMSERESASDFKPRPNPLRSIYIILQKESSLVIVYSGTLFAGYYMVLSSMPAQFGKKYNFNTLQIGLCYIPTGLGSMAASVVTGKLLNWNFRRHAKACGLQISEAKQQDLTNFPIEAARLQIVSPLVYIAAATVVCYGWVMESHTSLAGPVIFLLISTFCMTGSFTGLSTLVVDLNRQSAGTATAAMNLVRCWSRLSFQSIFYPVLSD